MRVFVEGGILALKILANCINCDVCEPACPNQAIVLGVEYYEIIDSRCTECVGHYDEPQCHALCPIDDCIITDPDHIEDQAQLHEKFLKLTAQG